MKTAKGVIMVMKKTQKCVDAQWRFLSHIEQAVNKDAQLNNEQEDLLRYYVDTIDEVKPSFTDAISVATWINSCH